jgi:serine protease Do
MIRSGIAGVLVFFAAATAGAADSPALDLARQLNSAFIEVAEKVSPSVVVIRVEQPERRIDESSPFWDMMPPEFRRRLEKQREEEETEKPRRNSNGRPQYNGRGSGVILSEDGYIITNFHVVEDATAIEVRLRDNRRFTATVQGSDRQSDVAVLKIQATNLPAAKLGDSAALRVGEFVVAIGAPFDLDYTVTYGHVSAKGRSPIPAFGLQMQGQSMDQDYLQTDASINPGNSGGPLVNLYGEVIGINTLIRGLHTGIGFAIPVNHVRDISTALVKEGKFVRSWLGVGIRDLADDEEFQQLTPDLHAGVIVTSLQPNGPAIKSDLRPQDVITAVDGRAVGTTTQLRSEVRNKPAGSSVTLDVVRLDEQKKSRSLKVKVIPEAWPETTQTASTRKSSKATAVADIGFEVNALTKELRTRHKVQEETGVIVTRVRNDGPATTKLQPGDVIVGVNHKPVNNLDEFAAAIANADLGKGILLEVISGGNKHSQILRQRGE